jgi:NAD dependent epimerase/dehydratase family enzyme
MLPAIRLGTGSAIGSGRQFVPWIHIDDLCNIYIKAIEDSYLNGVFNSVAPSHVTNGELMKTIASVLNRPFIFPNIPALFMKILFGEMSNMLLEGSRVSAEKILMTGFAFRYPDLEGALRNLVGRS